MVISQDLEELIEISDVIAVLNEGRMSEAKPSNRLTREEIGLDDGRIPRDGRRGQCRCGEHR